MVLVLAGARIVYFTQSYFNAVVCCFEFTLWVGSQLNTSEMFCIDISRWMISSRCRWISVYLPWRTAHALNLDQSCNMVSSHNPVNCPPVICLPRIAVLSSFGRDITSERHGAPVHVHIIGHFAIYFPSLLLSAFTFRSTIHH